MSDVVIKAEGLGKKYTIGHQAENGSYLALRDVLMQNAVGLWHKTRDLARGRPLIVGDTHEEMWALRDVSFEIRRGETVGIIGRNGAGKSTLLKVLSRITEPSAGRVTIKGRVASLLEVGTGFHPELTGRENIYLNGAILGMTRAEIKRKFDEIVAFAEVERFLDTPVKRYSSGMYVRLAFAVAAHLEPEILVVDEVLAVGDAAFQKKSLGKMGEVAKEGRTVLFVSHNMGAISNLCERGVVLDRGMLVLQGASREAIEFYNHQVTAVNHKHPDRSPHIIYESSDDVPQEPIAVSKIEVLDTAGNPKPVTATWDDIVFRISYRSRDRIQKGSVVLDLVSLDGSRILSLSTQPDGTLPLTLEIGEHCVECVIEKLPLASAEYIVGAGLAIPNIEWLWRGRELGKFTVVASDVYGSGLAPTASRALIAPQHSWRIVV